MKNKTGFALLMLIGYVTIFTSSCKKDETNVPVNLTNEKTTAVFNPAKTYGTVTDIDGNVYKTITIGTQTWMAENLRTTRYRNGDSIPNLDGPEWISLKNGACCRYNNTKNTDTIATFGRLYNGYAVNDSRNIAPTGWHVATDEEWNKLTEYLGGFSSAAFKLKEKGTMHWLSPNLNATNETGFTAIPAGYRGNSKSFVYAGEQGLWWTSTMTDTDKGLARLIYNTETDVITILVSSKNFGFSVRCVKD